MSPPVDRRSCTALLQTCLSSAKKLVTKLSFLDPRDFPVLFLLFLLSILVSIICFNQVVHAGHPTSFPPTDERAAFTAGPSSRGTVAIIWMCLSTIFTCVYVSLHLDLPEKGEQGRIKAMQRKLLWMVLNVVAPEMIAYVAVSDFLRARHLKEATRELMSWSDKDWTLPQSFFAGMGGFKVRVVPPSGDERLAWSRRMHDKTQDITIPTAWEFNQWLRDNPSLAEEIDIKQVKVDIADKSKADSVLKAITILQASWLVVQTVVRACGRQAVSPLEVTTCAYVMCAVFTYACWWQKPYGVQKRILLLVPKLESYRPPEVSGFYLTPFNRGDSADKATDVIDISMRI